MVVKVKFYDMELDIQVSDKVTVKDLKKCIKYYKPYLKENEMNIKKDGVVLEDTSLVDKNGTYGLAMNNYCKLNIFLYEEDVLRNHCLSGMLPPGILLNNFLTGKMMIKDVEQIGKEFLQKVGLNCDEEKIIQQFLTALSQNVYCFPGFHEWVYHTSVIEPITADVSSIKKIIFKSGDICTIHLMNLSFDRRLYQLSIKNFEDQLDYKKEHVLLEYINKFYPLKKCKFYKIVHYKCDTPSV